MGLSTTPRWMAMRDREASFNLAHGRIELSIFGHNAGGTDTWRGLDGTPQRLFTKCPAWTWERSVGPHCLGAGHCSMVTLNSFGTSGS